MDDSHLDRPVIGAVVVDPDRPSIGAVCIARDLGLAEPDGSVSDRSLAMVYGFVKRGIISVDHIGKYITSTPRRLRTDFAAAAKRAKTVGKDLEVG
jgi:hypothetical protein